MRPRRLEVTSCLLNTASLIILPVVMAGNPLAPITAPREASPAFFTRSDPYVWRLVALPFSAPCSGFLEARPPRGVGLSRAITRQPEMWTLQAEPSTFPCPAPGEMSHQGAGRRQRWTAGQWQEEGWTETASHQWEAGTTTLGPWRGHTVSRNSDPMASQHHPQD